MLTLPIKIAAAKEKSSTFFIELYEIYMPQATLRYAAADEDIVFNGNTYLAAPIQRDTVKATADSKLDNCKLTVSDFDSSFTLALLTGYNFLGCRAVIFQIMYPESLTDPLCYAPIMWGDLDSPQLTTKNATFTVDIIAPTTYLENARTMQLPCNSQFADGESCMAALDLRTGTVQAGSTEFIVNTGITVANGAWNSGLITVGWETRLIVASSGSMVTVAYPFRSVPTGVFSIQRGCDKSDANCAIHGRQVDYSGFKNVPFETTYKT